MSTPTILDPIPADIHVDLNSLKADLDSKIPAKKLEQNLLIATWNIRGFGDLTSKWKSAGSDSPKRDFHSVHCIAEILKRFDVIAVQEVKANLKALRNAVKLLGDNYAFLLTDVNQGNVGNGERMAYIFETRRVQLSGLAGDTLNQTFMSEGLHIPTQLADPKVTRSIFDETKFYDQIAWFQNTQGINNLNMEFLNGGNYNFVGKALANRNLSKQSLSFMLSDYLPLWAEFKL